MQKNAACTIVSKNYISYAKTLGDSFKKLNSNEEFYILLVDDYDEFILRYTGGHKIVKLEDLDIDKFYSIAFRFDVLELNTNVKASFLKYLLKVKKYEKVIYFDPDIYIYQNVTEIFDKLDKYSILLTPHSNSPYPEDEMSPNEEALLNTGTFNLGFIAVSNTKESIYFLNWWESKCLKLGFNEKQTGLFVDQKWINLLPCFLDSVYIIKDPGYNMAYWNVHERHITKDDNTYIVNSESKLLFFHFSGLDIKQPKLLSKYQTRYDFIKRTDLVELFDDYRNKLIDNSIFDTKVISYSYNQYSNGEIIPNLARKLYGVFEKEFCNINPFDAEGDFYKWLLKNNIKGVRDTSGQYNINTYNPNDFRLLMLHKLFRILLKIVGVDKYTMLMKYLSYISILRNQKEIFKKNINK